MKLEFLKILESFMRDKEYHLLEGFLALYEKLCQVGVTPLAVKGVVI